jgi:hypothetical protein
MGVHLEIKLALKTKKRFLWRKRLRLPKRLTSAIPLQYTLHNTSFRLLDKR